MPYVKSISVHSTPYRTIKYILDPDKTEDLLYASGINCSAVKDVVYEEMKRVFEEYSDHPFEERKSAVSKNPVKLFHFIQSFKPTDDITPEQAHSIAHEWAKKAFGESRQILIATHIDKGHIHSHVVINPYDLNGKKYNSNKRTLQQVRELSDTIAKHYGLSVIETKPQSKVTSYKEWDSKRKGISWKQDIKDSIDRLVYEVKSLDELYRKLTENGYSVRREKHTTISIPTAEDERRKSVRIDNVKVFGEGYSDEELEERIATAVQQRAEEEQEQKSTDSKKSSNPLEQLYTQRIRQVARLVMNGEKVQKKYNKKLPYSVENDYEVYRLAKQLQIIKRDGIVSIDHLEKLMNEVKIQYESTRQEINTMNEKQRQFKTVIDDARVYLKFKDIPPEQLSSAQRLQLQLAHRTVGRTNIQSQADVDKIKRIYDINESKIRELNAAFDTLERQYAEYADISAKCREVTREDYITKIKDENDHQKKTDLK